MNPEFKNIDPGAISICADGSIFFENCKLRDAAVARDGDDIPSSTNSGSCTNSGTCGGANLNCTNKGDCDAAQNFGGCGIRKF